jgi:uncharacterized phiE125 gp8 family phage protein
MALKIITPPAEEPVTPAEAKASPSFRVTGTTDDADITSLITTAREMAEAITRRALITQTLEIVLDGFPSGGIELYCPPIQSVASIKYIDTDGVEQTLDPLLYAVDDDSEPGLVVPAYGESWPSTRDQVNAVRVRYVAGYGAAADVPAAFKTWIKMRAGTLYDNSQAIIIGTIVTPIPRDFLDGLLDPYRVITFR